MSIGWLDFSKEDRGALDRALSALEKGTVDELGFGTVRDGFRRAMFPGAALPITRLRYHFFLAYMYADVDKLLEACRRDSVPQARELVTHLQAFKLAEDRLRDLLVKNSTGPGIIGVERTGRYAYAIGAYRNNLKSYGLVRQHHNMLGNETDFFDEMDKRELEHFSEPAADKELDLEERISWNLDSLAEERTRIVKLVSRKNSRTPKGENLFRLTDNETTHFKKVCRERYPDTLLNLMVEHKLMLEQDRADVGWDKLSAIVEQSDQTRFEKTRKTFGFVLDFNRLIAQAYNYYWSMLEGQMSNTDVVMELQRRNAVLASSISVARLRQLIEFIKDPSRNWFQKHGGQEGFLLRLHELISSSSNPQAFERLVTEREQSCKGPKAKLDKGNAGESGRGYDLRYYYYNFNLAMVASFVEDLW